MSLPSDDHSEVELQLTESAGITPQLSSDVTIERIREMVELFYSRTQQDDLLGPIFTEHVADWGAHYERMTRFWSSATMRAGTYSGRPIEAHRFGGFTELHFDRWIQLFTKTSGDVFGQADADIFVSLAKRMASTIAMRIGVGRLVYD